MYFAVKYFLYKPKCKSKHSTFFLKIIGRNITLNQNLIWTFKISSPVTSIWTLYRWSNKSSEVWLYLTIYQYFYDILFACLMIKPSIISYACVFWNKKNVFTETQQQMHLSGCLLFQCWHCNNFTKSSINFARKLVFSNFLLVKL